jgi:16S rRNA C1402 N4-methylase RsmH
MSHFSNIVSRAQQLLSDILQPGDLAIDLTAGNGSDTLFLAKAVGQSGRVLAFDIQQEALLKTAEKLRKVGIFVENTFSKQQSSGVTLICANHDTFSRFIDSPPRGIIANLGYLPGGDETLTTHKASTVSALQQATDVLTVGGRLAVVVYPGHPGGDEEGEAVDSLFSLLPLNRWQVLRISVANAAAAPYLLVAEKR